MTAEVKIHVVNDNECGGADVSVSVNGRLLFNERAGGGEPEDNLYYRDWNWVVQGIKLLAAELGADVEITEMER